MCISFSIEIWQTWKYTETSSVMEWLRTLVLMCFIPHQVLRAHLGRVGSRLSQPELFSVDTYHTFLLYYQHCLWKVISSSNPENSFSDCFLMHLVSVHPLICQVVLNRSFHDFLWGFSFKMRTHFTWESHQQFASVTWPLSILSQLSVLFKLKLLVAYFYCCSGVKWK